MYTDLHLYPLIYLMKFFSFANTNHIPFILRYTNCIPFIEIFTFGSFEVNSHSHGKVLVSSVNIGHYIIISVCIYGKYLFILHYRICMTVCKSFTIIT